MKSRISRTVKKVSGKPKKVNSANTSLHARKSPGSSSGKSLFLQGIAGNRVVQRMASTNAIQTKLRIGKPGDKYEREADSVADQVMRMPDAEVRRKPT